MKQLFLCVLVFCNFTYSSDSEALRQKIVRLVAERTTLTHEPSGIFSSGGKCGNTKALAHCQTCDIYLSRGSLTGHQKLHAPHRYSRSYCVICIDCECAFATKKSLAKHVG